MFHYSLLFSTKLCGNKSILNILLNEIYKYYQTNPYIIYTKFQNKVTAKIPRHTKTFSSNQNYFSIHIILFVFVKDNFNYSLGNFWVVLNGIITVYFCRISKYLKLKISFSINKQ